jgi:hypothetical protein
VVGQATIFGNKDQGSRFGAGTDNIFALSCCVRGIRVLQHREQPVARYVHRWLGDVTLSERRQKEKKMLIMECRKEGGELIGRVNAR